MAKRSNTSNAYQKRIEEIKAMALADLRVFAKLVNPHRVYGQIHNDLFKWWNVY